MLQVYHQSLVDGTFKIVNINNLLPIILNNDGTSETIFYFKNTSNKILSNINLHINNIEYIGGFTETDFGITSAITDLVSDPTTYTSGISHSMTNEIYPGDGFRLYVKTNSLTNINIDYGKILLDITYNYADISTNDMLVLFEFLEDNGVLSITDTINNIVATISSDRVIRGNGIAYLENNETITFISGLTNNCFTFIVKGIFDIKEANYKIVTIGNVELGINTQRQIYIKIGNSTITTERTLINYNSEYVIILSITDTNNILLTINGVKSSLNNIPEQQVDVDTNESTEVVIGNGLIGELSIVSLYNIHHNLAFHNEFYVRTL